MTLEDAIKTAIEFESRVYATYQEAQEKAADATGRRVFSILAKEEAGHIAYLRDRLREWQETGTVQVAALETAIPDPLKIEAAAGTLEQKLEENTHRGKDEVRLLERALKVEQETSDFYQQMVDELDGDGRALFSRFLEIEQGHQAIVQAEIDAVNGNGFWFDMPEFRLG